MGVLVSASLLALLLAVEGFKISVPAVPDQDTVQSKIYKKQAALPRTDLEQAVVPPPAVEDSAAHSAAYSPLVYDYSTPQLHRFTAQDGIGSPTTLNDYSQYERLAEYEAEHTPSYKTAEYQSDDEFDDEEQFLRNEEGYTHYKTSSNIAFEGPHQIEEIETKSFHKEVPKYDVSGFRSHDMPKHHGKHKEVHYHQHKHMHKHEHKQEHVHQHKQEHKHAHEEHHKHGHEHKNEHKHDHHEDHKHGHEHKSEHKHGHHEGHKHGHEHKEEHKHGHHEAHKHGHHHKHHQDHKHDHHHGHKHHNEHKHHEDHGHKHDHHHGHKHDHHQDHKHHEDHGHKHDHHHGHKHQAKHGHKHDHKHGHKHSHHHSKH